MFMSTISDGIDGFESTESESTTDTDEPKEPKDPVPSVLCARQLTTDTIAGIVRDWTYISAGLPGPWTGYGGAYLRQRLDELGIPKVSFAHRDIYCKHEEPSTSAEESCKMSERAALPDWIDDDDLELALEANAKPRKRRRTNEAVHEGRRLSPELSRPSDRQRTMGYSPPAPELVAPHRLKGSINDSPRLRKRNVMAVARETNYHPSKIPLSSGSGGASVFFISELIPHSFEPVFRRCLIRIFRQHAAYLPICVVGKPRLRPYHFFRSLAQNQSALNNDKITESPLGNTIRYPRGTYAVALCSTQKLPLEIVDKITRYLTRRDVENMRLVCSDFERKTSSLFRSVVVPFTSDIFNMLHTRDNLELSLITSGDGRRDSLASSSLPYDNSYILRPQVSSGGQPALTDYRLKGKERAKAWVETSEEQALHRDTKWKDQSLDRRATKAARFGPRSAKELGMQVFSGWGPHVVQFALAYDFFESTLSNLPDKNYWVSWRAFWGKFPWPPSTYQRFEETKKLEQTADRGKHMAEAMSYLTNVRELGLSLDSGLGWLHGSDQSDRVKTATGKSKVFGARYSRSEESLNPLPSTGGMNTVFNLGNNNSNIDTKKEYIRLLSLLPPENDDFLRTIVDYLKQNPTELLKQSPGDDTNPHAQKSHPQAESVLSRMKSLGRSRRFGPHRMHVLDTQVYTDLHRSSSLMLTLMNIISLDKTSYLTGDKLSIPVPEDPNEGHTSNTSFLQQMISASERDVCSSVISGSLGSTDIEKQKEATSKGTSLIPNNLTESQKQCLLEVSWAQEAMLNSYILAIMDSRPMATNISTLTIAKLSSSYLPILNRADFWAALSGLANVTLLISADWRRIEKQNDQMLKDVPMHPSSAAAHFHDLLQNQISPSKRIRQLQVGYVCGGEHATGLFDRNQHVLPAPVAGLTSMGLSWALPYVNDLTFTNCWFTGQMLKDLLFWSRASDLRSLKLDSVSLVIYGGLTHLYPREYHSSLFESAASPRTGPQTNLAFGLPRPAFDNGQVLGAAASPNAWMADPAAIAQLSRSNDTWIKAKPLRHSWAEVLDAITPHDNLAKLRYNHSHPGWESPPPATFQNNLVRIRLDSCGYVKMPWQIVLPESHPGPPPGPLRNRMQELQSQMMASGDLYLGTIVPVILRVEECLLKHAFGMRLGWGENIDRYNNIEDGQMEGGSGRFSGVLDRQGTDVAHC